MITMDISNRKAIDLLVNEFWRLGFFTISRRFGTYLPEPETVGTFTVDVIGRLKEKYAIGIMLSKEDVFNSNLLEKLIYLATRKTRNSNKHITLIVGVPSIYFKQVKELLSSIEEPIKKNIKLTRIEDTHLDEQKVTRHSQQVFFS
jgi:hypothetical protein